MFQRRAILALALEEGAILAAEVRAAGRVAEVRRAVPFVFPAELPADDPQAVGRALREVLHRNGFRARHAVVGLPARWLLSVERSFPAANGGALAGMLRLDAERSFATGVDQLLLDYAGGNGTNAARRTLLVAVNRRHAARVQAMAQAAGLRVSAMAPTAMLLAQALKATSSLLLSLRPGHVELAVCSGGRFRALRHLSVAVTGEGWTAALRAEVRRAWALLPADGASAPEELVVWNGAGVDATLLENLGEDVAPRTRVVESVAGNDLAPLNAVPTEDAARCAPAIALGMAAARGRALPVDFLHSRLAVRRPAANRRRLVWAAVALAAVLAAGVGWLVQWRRDQAEVQALAARLDRMKPDIEAARRVVDRVTLARGWFDRRPPFLDCLRAMTLAFPQEGRIWVTSLAVREDMRVVVTGKADDERTVIETLDRIRKQPRLADAKLLYVRESTGATRDRSFSLSFAFVEGK